MKILSVEPILINMALKWSYAAGMSGGSDKRENKKLDVYTLLVKIETDEGIVGWGEAFANAGWMATHAAIKHIIAPRVVGRDPTQITQLMQSLFRGLYSCGRSGPVVNGLSGVDIALWDIAGKRAGKPLNQLLGGTGRASVPAYASLLRYGDASSVSTYVSQALERGYRAIKLHEHQYEVIRSARNAAGENIPIMVDCSCSWDMIQALEMARRLEDLNLTWLEEPLYPPDDQAGLVRMRRESKIPIAAGENVLNLFEFRRLFEMGALSYAQPSVTKVGGVTELRKIFALAESFAVPVVPHSPYFGPGFLASVHVCAASTQSTWIERYYCDFVDNFFDIAVHPREGNIVVPLGPGLGADPDPDMVKALRVA